VSFGREKRLLLAGLAALAPLPLPFNELLGWPYVAAFEIAVAIFVLRVVGGAERWLPLWAMNVLGLLYLPFLWVELAALRRGQLVEPLQRLVLFALAVKLFALHREADKWHALMGIFFLFLAAMGTSVHPTILLYLIAFSGLAMLTLARFAVGHVLAGFGHRDEAQLRVPLGGFLVAAVAATLLAAVPLFALLPRVRTPYIVGRGVGTGTLVHASGFSDEMTLDVIGQIRTSREVALRLRYEGPPPAGELRYKGATYDEFRTTSWAKSESRGEPLARRRDKLFHLAPGEPVIWSEIWLRPLGTSQLILPVETVVLDVTALRLQVDEGGAVALERPPVESVTQYRAGMAAAPLSAALPPWAAGQDALDQAGVSAAIRELAGRVAGEGPDAERAARLERHLLEGYEYTLDYLGASGEDPIADFLFRDRRGHCEYFASALVLMLRAEGIPARLVTGFLGAEYNPLEGYYIVRQSNAHAWVEAYLEEQGWRTLDPTPPSGRPGGLESGLGLLAAQAWDYLLFRWDRYVLTYSFYDQVRVFLGLRGLWQDLWRRLRRPEPVRSPGAETTPAEEPAPVGAPEDEALWLDAPSWLGLLGVILLVAAWWAWRHRPPLTATRAYRRLRDRLTRSGSPVSASLPPLAMRRQLSRRHPQAAAPAARVVGLYLEESFGGRELSAEERQRLAEDLREAGRAMRRA
jgi:hypothetical protein